MYHLALQSLMRKTINLSQFLGKKAAILHSDGIRASEHLSSSFDGTPIVISFEGLAHVTTAFLHASIGNFLSAVSGGDPKHLLDEQIVTFEGVGEKSGMAVQLKRAIARIAHPELAKIEESILEEYHFS
jgi:hypothetical protein